MAEGKADPDPQLDQSEASKLDDFGENKKDSVDCLVGAQENAGGEGENAHAIDVNSNNLQVRLAKAKKNRNRHRKRRNKKSSKDGLTPSNESNDALVGTDTEETSNAVAATDLDSSPNGAQEHNFEIKQIVLGSSSNTVIECAPEESEDAMHSTLQTQSSTTEQSEINGPSEDECALVVISSSVTDTETEDSKLVEPIGNSSNNLAQDENFESKEVIVVSSSKNFADCIASQEENSVNYVLQGQSSNSEQQDGINEFSNDEYEACANSSALNIIFQSEGVNDEIENVESEDNVLSNVTAEEVEAMNKLNREWDECATQDDYLNNTIWSDDIKPQLIDSEQGFDPQVKSSFALESDMAASPSSSSHIHLRVPNPSIERLESEELNSSRPTSGHKSLFRRESGQISSVAPFNSVDVNEILQLACIKVEKEQGIESDPAKWGLESPNTEPSTEVQAEHHDLPETDPDSEALRTTESVTIEETVVEVPELQPVESDHQEKTFEIEVCKISHDDLNNRCERAEQGSSEPSELLIDVEKDSNILEANAINNSSVAISSEDDFMDKLIKGNSSPTFNEGISQDNLESLLPSSMSDTSNEPCEICPDSPSVNIIFQSEEATSEETEMAQSDAVVHVYSRTINPEVKDEFRPFLSESHTYATEEDRLNNNYWPPDSKSEVNLHDENENLAAVDSVAAALEEIRPRTSSNVGAGVRSKPSLNVYDVSSSVAAKARVGANSENHEEDKEVKKFSWKSLLPCLPKNIRSRSKDRSRTNMEATLGEEENRKKRGSSLPRFLERKKTDKSKIKVADPVPKIPPP